MARRQFMVDNGVVTELAPEDFIDHPHVIFEENRWGSQAFSEEELRDLAKGPNETLNAEIQAELDRRRNQSPKES
jgi:hypothetical protein